MPAPVGILNPISRFPKLTLDTLPPELWQEIFSFACIDDGSTGRGLSAVSRIVRHLSAPYSIQSVAIRGYVQLSSFVSILREFSPERRRVKFLFISMIPASTMAAIKFEYHRRNAFASEYQELLSIIAPTLEVLYTSMDYAQPFYLIPPRSPLPVLRELSIFDGPKLSVQPLPSQFPDVPSLQHLHLINPTTQVPKHIASYPKSLINLRISAPWIQGCLASFDMTDKANDIADRVNPLGPQCTVWLSCPSEKRWKGAMEGATRVGQDRDWIKLLPENHKYQPPGPTAAKEAWLERLAGHTWW